jgi:hypothetical protein
MGHCEGVKYRAGTTLHPLAVYAQLLVFEFVQRIDHDFDG